ncbi:aspartate-semialdehyde dehydrogenase [Bradyrhizobium sp. AUGA SZCCT0283]|uniref:aspartate-semialdehyde dehydrogenase n=1 Tax=Bradyrhizobium sp. AUGA SZCCT0283 TaxID=2807671 RepID=UPI001BA691C8|nr:aspartate-semialdehyde dehydrogenase [Bradyrhizobium sp. AUGA SZCCT0283]MBR1278789.1 aspartate-semialdehyde dehydrogenase [Bradyrhizobium sp. AUGA SZCCT0283]
MSYEPVVAIAGVTGAVGAEFIATMDRRAFPVRKLKALASARSAGKTIGFRGERIVIEELTEKSFEGVDIALFSAGGGTSRKFAPAAVKAGAVVVDNSSAFRMDPSVPLVIPEINAGRIRDHKGIIANPNCSAITALVPLWPIHRQNRIKRMIVSTYQAASGAGAAAMEELMESTRAYLDGRPFTPKVIPLPYAFNVFSHNTAIDPETGYNDEETKVIKETRKIFEDDQIAIGVTCVRVPVLRAHCEAITFECERPITEADVRAILANAPGVKIVDDRAKNYFPMPIDASGQDDVLVGRIRKDLSDASGRSISMFVSADQLLKGAALNAIQIAELLPQRAMA